MGIRIKLSKKCLFVLLYLIFNKANAQIFVKKYDTRGKCKEYKIYNASSDSLYLVLVSRYFTIYGDPCTDRNNSALWVYPKDRLININISHTQIDFDKELGHYVYLYPNDSLLFNINNPYDTLYNVNFMFYARSYRLKKGYKKRNSVQNNMFKLAGRMHCFYNVASSLN